MTEPHVGYSKNQIAQAVLDPELDTTPANAVVIDAVAKFCPQSDQRGQEGEMHDVFIVTSEGSGGGHIVRTVYAADHDERAEHTKKTTPTSPLWRFTNKPSRLVTSGGVRARCRGTRRWGIELTEGQPDTRQTKQTKRNPEL